MSSQARLLSRVLAASMALFAAMASAGTLDVVAQPPSTSGFALVRMLDGRVLMANGYASPYGADTDAARSFDPATNIWRDEGRTPTKRVNGQALVLATGKVMVYAGSDGSQQIADIDLFDPLVRRWSRAARAPATGGSAVLLRDGKVLLVTSGAAYRYDPGTNLWTTVASPAIRRYGPALVVLKDGQVLAIGGTLVDGSTVSPSVESFDPATGQWRQRAALPAARAQHSATLLLDGRVLVTGGYATAQHRAESTAFTYDLVGDTWSAAESMPVARAGHQSILLQSGRVLVMGGIGLPNSQFVEFDEYLPGANRWLAVTPYIPTLVPVGVALADGRALVVPDRSLLTQIGSAFAYNPGTRQDCVFDWLQTFYPQFFAGPTPTRSMSGWTVRSYSAPAAHLGFSNGTLYYLGPVSGNSVVPLGAEASWLARSDCGV